MSQANPVIGADKSGLTYRGEDNDGKKALLNHHKGATAPSYAEAGILWLDDAATPWVLKMYDGTDWIAVGHVNATTNKFSPFVDGVALDGIASPIFAEEFESTEQTITSGGTLTLAHGLSAAPKLVQVFAICKTAEHNYSIGDVIMIANEFSTTALNGFGFQSRIDDTNVYITMGGQSNVLLIMNKTSGAINSATNANWKLIVKAWG